MPRPLAILAAVALGLQASAFAATRPETMPLSEVQPGMVATVQTVFDGDGVEEFEAEIVGVMEGFLGPAQSLILARLKGERVQFTGVAAGMSGSPVYIGGRLVGALSYRIGEFMKEPIAGITPIEYMLAMDGHPHGSLPAARAGRPGSESSAVPRLEPIETPLVAAGVAPAVLDAFAGDLARFGLGHPVSGAAGGGSTAPGGHPHPLVAGQAVAAQLVTGDLSLAVTGTVTLVDGDRVFAFGHPSLVTGSTQFPMARAEIYLTLPSLRASTKMSRVLETIGTFEQSRLPGITGQIGPRPRMIPVTLKTSAQNGPPRAFHYEILQHRELAPVLVAVVSASSLLNVPWAADEMTLAMTARVSVEGHPDMVFSSLYAGFAPDQPAAVTLARDVQDLCGLIFGNRFLDPDVRAVEVEVSTVERGRLSFVEAVYPSRTVVEAGDEVEIRVLIRPYRGDGYSRRFIYRVPEGTPPGPVVAYVGGGNVLSAAERPVVARQAVQAEDLGQLIGVVNRLRANDRLYLKIARRQSGAVVQSEVLPALPPSVLSTIIHNQGRGEVALLQETTLHEDSIPLEEILVGGAAIFLRIR